MEIVSLGPSQQSQFTNQPSLSVTGGRISPKPIILPKKFRSTISRIIDHDRNSALPSTFLLTLTNRIFALRFQKAIKKVRAVQRMRRNRGFAFSQTENAARQDQARLIRAYDTSKTGARPSGY